MRHKPGITDEFCLADCSIEFAVVFRLLEDHIVQRLVPKKDGLFGGQDTGVALSRRRAS
jgi:hypothetical protein